jgi:hypothetical protein
MLIGRISHRPHVS